MNFFLQILLIHPRSPKTFYTIKKPVTIKRMIQRITLFPKYYYIRQPYGKLVRKQKITRSLHYYEKLNKKYLFEHTKILWISILGVIRTRTLQHLHTTTASNPTSLSYSPTTGFAITRALQHHITTVSAPVPDCLSPKSDLVLLGYPSTLGKQT